MAVLNDRTRLTDLLADMAPEGKTAFGSLFHKDFRRGFSSVLLDMFLTFAKVGVMTFGGGYAMLPILQREVVERKGWATEEELADYFAIGQCTPGVIAVNTATFIGKKKAGIPGGIIATLGVVFPSLIIITLLASVISIVAELEVVKHAFAGIRVCVCVLIFNAVLKLAQKAVVDKITLIIAISVAVFAFLTEITPTVFVLVCGVIGLLIGFFRAGKEKK